MKNNTGRKQLTVPTEAELETEQAVNVKDSFDTIPATEKTISAFKAYFEKAMGEEITNEKAIELMKSDPNPKEYEEKEMKTKRREEQEENYHSEFIKDVIAQVENEK